MCGLALQTFAKDPGGVAHLPQSKGLWMRPKDPSPDLWNPRVLSGLSDYGTKGPPHLQAGRPEAPTP